MLHEMTENTCTHTRIHKIMGTSDLLGLGVVLVEETLEQMILGLNLKGRVGIWWWENWRKGLLLNYYLGNDFCYKVGLILLDS